MPTKVWHADNETSADWLIAGSRLAGVTWEKHLIPAPGSAAFMNAPEVMKQILRLDAPDLLVTVDRKGADVPAISIELTKTTPQSQHAKQRFPRLVAAAEANVPAIYVIAERKAAVGPKGTVYYRLGEDLYYGASKLHTINGIPVFIYHWPDHEGDLLDDPTFPGQPLQAHRSIRGAFRTIDTAVKHILDGGSPKDLYKEAWIASEQRRHSAIARKAKVAVSNYTTLTEINTSDLEEFLATNTRMSSSRIRKTLGALPHRIHLRPRSLVFRPGGRLFDHAGDPYVGMLAFFDYAFCRSGRSVEDRAVNLIHMPVKEEVAELTSEFAPAGYHAYWKDKCPFGSADVPDVDAQFRISHHLQYGCVFAKKKPMRIMGYFADMLVFQDAILPF